MEDWMREVRGEASKEEVGVLEWGADVSFLLASELAVVPEGRGEGPAREKHPKASQAQVQVRRM